MLCTDKQISNTATTRNVSKITKSVGGFGAILGLAMPLVALALPVSMSSASSLPVAPITTPHITPVKFDHWFTS
jgi:hypothetical protein